MPPKPVKISEVDQLKQQITEITESNQANSESLKAELDTLKKEIGKKNELLDLLEDGRDTRREAMMEKEILHLHGMIRQLQSSRET